MNESPQILKLKPANVQKPWGLVHGEARSLTGIEVGIGEFWLASAQTGEGNYSNVITEPDMGISLDDLLDRAREGGEDYLEKLLGWRARQAMSQGHRGKTEAWRVRVADGVVGLVSGPSTEEQKSQLREWIEDGTLTPDVQNWPDHVKKALGVIESLSPGDVFLVPCGTLHTMYAVGDDSRLVIDELQQGYGESLLPTLSKILMVQDSVLSVQVHPCDDFVAASASGEVDVAQDLQLNPTVRIYDFGRGRDEDPELGFHLTDLEAGLRRVPTVEVRPAEGVELEMLVADREFLKAKLNLGPGIDWSYEPASGSFQVLHCTAGRVTLNGGDAEISLGPGETAFVPAVLEEGLRLQVEEPSTLLADCYPDLDKVEEFLREQGVPEEEMRAFFNPPKPA